MCWIEASLKLSNRDEQRIEEELLTIEANKIWAVMGQFKKSNGTKSIASRLTVDQISAHRPSYRDLTKHEIINLDKGELIYCHCPNSIIFHFHSNEIFCPWALDVVPISLLHAKDSKSWFHIKTGDLRVNYRRELPHVIQQVTKCFDPKNEVVYQSDTGTFKASYFLNWMFANIKQICFK